MTITSSTRFFLFLPIMECRKQRIPLIFLVKKKNYQMELYYSVFKFKEKSMIN